MFKESLVSAFRGFGRTPYGRLAAFVHAAMVALGLLLAAPASASPPRLVVAYGDSLMAGYRLKPGDGFAPQLERALRAKGIAATVKNAGVSGDTTAAGRARLAWVLGGLKEKPDLVILGLGANDMLRGLDPAEAKANLDAMLSELDRRGIPVLVAGMLAAPNLGKAYGAKFNAMYPALAKAHGDALYPFFLKGVATNKPLLLDDGMHPNPKGVATIVRNILPSVEAALR